RGVIDADHRAIENDSGKQTFGSGVRQYRRLQLDISSGLCLTPNRSRRNSRVRTQLNLAVHQSLEAVLTGEYEDQIGCLRSDLESKITATDLDECRRTPFPVIHPAGHQTF